jgi:hypothetical protein
MVRLKQPKMAMRSTKDQLAQRFDRAQNANTSRKLQKVVADIKECGNANLTRLTILKKWFEAPHHLPSFGVFIAIQASRQTNKETEKVAELFDEAREVLADVNVFEPDIPRTDAARLHARLQAFQNERRDMKWAAVRLIHNQNLFLVEGGLHLYLWHGASSTEGYRLAANYCEHYDPRYGTGLNGPSINRIEEIAGFVLAREAHEAAELKFLLHES